MTHRTQFTSRPYAGEADVQPICDLLNRVDAAENLHDNYAPGDLITDFSDPDLDPAHDLRLWEDASGRLVAFGQLWLPRSSDKVDAYYYWRVDQSVYNSGIEDEMLQWAAQRTKEVADELGKPAELACATKDYYTYYRAYLEQHGFEIARYFFRMERDLSQPISEPQFPAGFTLRHSTGDADIEPWVEMYNLSFIDHFSHHPLSVETHRHWLQSEKYKAERDLIAIAPDGTYAAFCFCWIDPEANERNKESKGEIDLLGTRRGFRKIGLGRAMLLAGMRLLKDQGMAVAELGVDAENPTGAMRLYESVGFEKKRTTVRYHLALS